MHLMYACACWPSCKAGTFCVFPAWRWAWVWLRSWLCFLRTTELCHSQCPGLNCMCPVQAHPGKGHCADPGLRLLGVPLRQAHSRDLPCAQVGCAVHVLLHWPPSLLSHASLRKAKGCFALWPRQCLAHPADTAPKKILSGSGLSPALRNLANSQLRIGNLPCTLQVQPWHHAHKQSVPQLWLLLAVHGLCGLLHQPPAVHVAVCHKGTGLPQHCPPLSSLQFQVQPS